MPRRRRSAIPAELYPIGTLAKIAQVVRLQDGTVRAIVQGQSRLRVHGFVSTSPHLVATVEELPDASPKDLEVEALMKTVQAQIEQYVQSGAPVPPEAAVAARNISEPGLLADMVAYSPDMSIEQRQELLETIDVVERLKLVSAFLSRQVEILELKGKIQSEVKSELDKTQREYILREQLKAIQRELGEDDPQQAEIHELRDKVEQSGMPDEVRARALKEVDRMSRIPSASPEVGVIRTYVDWLVGLPWNISTDDNLDIREAARILDEDHYGLEKIKERILEYLAVRTLASTIRSPILCFVGPPGVGKTSLGKSIARAMGRKFVRMSLGGVHDEAEIRGHRRTYIGALPGRVIQSIKTSGSNNPVFMLDEVDKLGMDFRGDPSSALLEVLDPEQNNTFQDNYLEVPFDLSKVLFITTANLLDPIPAPLRDRMEVVQLPGLHPAARRSRSGSGSWSPSSSTTTASRRSGSRSRTMRSWSWSRPTPTRPASGTWSASWRTSCARSPGRSPKAASARPSSTSRSSSSSSARLASSTGSWSPRTRPARRRASWSPRSAATSSRWR